LQGASPALQARTILTQEAAMSCPQIGIQKRGGGRSKHWRLISNRAKLIIDAPVVPHLGNSWILYRDLTWVTEDT